MIVLDYTHHTVDCRRLKEVYELINGGNNEDGQKERIYIKEASK